VKESDILVYLITYDLIKERSSTDYEKLFLRIKSLGSYIHPLKSVWLVDTIHTTAKSVYETLTPALDENDLILVTDIGKNQYGILPRGSWDWIDQHNK
jgi:6-phosphogluconate dehydrogenase (decarboxylating)